VYIEALETDLLRQRKDAQELLAPLIAGADELAGIRKHLRMERPTVIT
jgi:phosphoglucomutase